MYFISSAKLVRSAIKPKKHLDDALEFQKVLFPVRIPLILFILAALILQSCSNTSNESIEGIWLATKATQKIA